MSATETRQVSRPETFTDRIRLLQKELSSGNPSEVVGAGDRLDFDLRFLEDVSNGTGALHYATFPDLAVQISQLANILSANWRRIHLAQAWHYGGPKIIDISKLAASYHDIVDANREFASISEEEGRKRLEFLTKKPVRFWGEGPISYEVKAAKAAVTAILADEMISGELKDSIQSQYSAKAKDLETTVLSNNPNDIQIRTRGLNRTIRELYAGDKAILDEISTTETVDGYVHGLIEAIKDSEVIIYMLKNIRSEESRDGLIRLADLLGEERIKKGFADLGIGKNDIRMMFALSLFDGRGDSFVEIARLLGVYDEQTYKDIVKRALITIHDDNSNFTLPYRGDNFTIKTTHFLTEHSLLRFVNSLKAIGFPLQHPLLQQVVRISAHRCRLKPADNPDEIEKNADLADGILIMAREIGILPQEETP